MLRRFFAGNEISEPDYLAVVNKLLKLPTFSERSLFVLRQLTALLPGDVRGCVVRREEGEQVRFDALGAYGGELLELRSGRELDPELVSLFVNILRQGKSTGELGRLDKQDLPF